MRHPVSDGRHADFGSEVGLGGEAEAIVSEFGQDLRSVMLPVRGANSRAKLVVVELEEATEDARR